jgi:hypothetical protein
MSKEVRATPIMIAAAWGAWHSRHGGKIGPGPAFVEAINAAIAKSDFPDIIRTAFAFVEELRRMGYGETSERALPGSFDPFLEALRKVKG